MPVHNLDGFFRPRSVALIGPPVLDSRAFDLLCGRLAVSGVPVARLDAPMPDRPMTLDGDVPDLAVIACGAEAGLAAVRVLAAAGTRCVLIVAASYDAWPDAAIDALVAVTRANGMRVIGPGSLGVAVPARAFNASLAAGTIPRGDLALASRSASMVNAMLAWGRTQHRLGFSAIVSLGQKADVDIGDLLDHFAQDPATRAVLIHLERVGSPSKFLSAARACARAKPVVVIRSGTPPVARIGGETDLSRLARSDAVHDAAFRRAGLLRVHAFDELFEACEIITRVRPVMAPRVALVANGASLAAIAREHLEALGGETPTVSAETSAILQPLVRRGAAPASPVVLPDGTTADSLAAAAAALAADEAVDAIVVIHAPHCVEDGVAAAAALAALAESRRRRQARVKPLVAAFLDADDTARARLEEAGIPCYDTPEAAIRAWDALTRFAEAQDHLTAMPETAPGRAATTRLSAGALLAGEGPVIPPAAARAVLGLYGLPVGENDEDGDLLAGVVDDADFGPVIVLAAGANVLERQACHALDLAPIDSNLARGLVERVAGACLLHGRPLPPAAREPLAAALVRLSDLVVDLPEIGTLALSGRFTSQGPVFSGIRMERTERPAAGGRLGHPRLTIRPYPRDWERHITIEGGQKVFVRPVRPEDEALYPAFLAEVTEEDIRLRFFAPMKEFPHAFLARLTQLDYARAIAFAALDETGAILGVVRLHADPDHRTGEYAILLRSGMKGRGLGRALMQLIIAWASADGIERITGEVLRTNGPMLALARDLGFTVHASPDDPGIAEVVLEVGQDGKAL